MLDAEVLAPLLPAVALCEIGHVAERRYGAPAVDAVLADVQSGALLIDCGESDIARVRHLLSRYADARIGLTDAFVAACAERNGGRLLTLDRRHFDVLGRELRLTVLP